MKRKPGEKAANFGEKGMRIARAYEILFAIIESENPLSAKQINQRVHAQYPFDLTEPCAVQTIREDIKTLRKCNFPIVSLNESGAEIIPEEFESLAGKFKNVKYTLRDPNNIPGFEFPLHRAPSSIDIISLSLCRALMQNFIPRGFPLYKVINKLLYALQIRVNSIIRNNISGHDALIGRVKYIGKKYIGEGAPADIFDEIVKAISNKSVLIGRYQNRDAESKEIDIAPLAVWFADGKCYVLAAGATDLKIRSWRVDRFEYLKIKKQAEFPKISEEEIQNYIQSSDKGYIGEPKQIKLTVRKKAAYLFRDYSFHPSQQITEQKTGGEDSGKEGSRCGGKDGSKDGSMTVTLNLVISWALEEWILSLGEFIKVEEPKELKDKIIKRLKETLGQYE